MENLKRLQKEIELLKLENKKFQIENEISKQKLIEIIKSTDKEVVSNTDQVEKSLTLWEKIKKVLWTR